MATMLLGNVGNAFGNMIAGPIGAAIGGMAASSLGSRLDHKLLGVGPATKFGARLDDFTIQTNTYGKMIPIVFGKARMAGNVIWSMPIQEHSETTRHHTKGSPTQKSVQFHYTITLAIAICEGEVDQLLRVWADDVLLDLSLGTHRFYTGTDEQMPDPLIESVEGLGKTPAYQGLCYIVIEDFPLTDFGNRLPNFTFEIERKVLNKSPNEPTLEDRIESMIMIPGSGEFVYDTKVQHKLMGKAIANSWAQQGYQEVINQHSYKQQADALTSLDQLEKTCPNVKWIGVVVGWFGNHLDAGQCTLMPGVEYQGETITQPDQWHVAGYSRNSARKITTDENNAPVYGGTPDDQSLLRYLTELRNRGYKIMLYPMFFMDVEDKPWRGRVTGTASDVATFFTKDKGYNEFIEHYAELTKDHVDAFIIGSELVGLTSVHSVDHFPAVTALVHLAENVKVMVGSDVKVSYAADWSEYHHHEGWYHLDPLWASPAIDFIGIDAYFPLTDEPQQDYDIQRIIDGWESGEGCDWVYDGSRTTRNPIAPEFAWKNISWW